MTNPLLVGQQLIILRDVPVTQEADFVEADKLPAQSLEDALDKLTMIAQQHDEELGRTITANESATPEQVETLRDNVTLLAANAERLIAVNSAVDILERVFVGNGSTTQWTLPAAPASEANVDVWINGVIQKTANYEVAGDKLTITPAVANGVEILTKTRVEVSLAYPTFGSDFLDPGPFGLVGDGVADDTAALQAYFNACVAQKKRAVLPAGKFSAVGIVVNNPLHITGQGGYETYDLNIGTWLIHRNTSAPLIRFTGVNARGSSLRGVNVFQQHPTISAPNTPGSWAPTTYPYVFDVVDCFGGVHFRQIFMWGVYRGISLVNSGRSTVHTLTGQFYQNVIFQDNQLDADAISEIHNWPHTNGSKAVYSWMHTNHASFILGRVDSAVYSGKIFSYAGRYLFQFAATANGKATRIKVHSAQADAIPCGIFVSAGANDVTAEFGILDIQGQDLSVWPETLASVPGVWPITIDADGARINIQSLRTEYHHQGLIFTPPSRKNNRLAITHLRGTSYNMSGNAPGAFSLGTTLPANNGGFPVNQVFVGNNLFLEGNNGAPQLAPGTTGVVNVAGSGGAGASGNQIITASNLTSAVVVDGVGLTVNSGGLQAQVQGDGNIIGSAFGAAGNLVDFIQNSGGGGGSSPRDTLTSASGTQSAKINNAGGFTVTDTVQSRAAAVTADGNLTGSAVAGKSIWEITVAGSTTYDLKNYLDRKFDQVVAGGSASSVIRSPDNLTALTMVNSVGARLDNNGVSIWTGDGNITGGGFSSYGGGNLFAVLGSFDSRLDALEAGGGGGGSSSQLVNGSATATLGATNGLTISSGGNAARVQSDGNIVNAAAFTNASNGGLGGTGSLTSYIDARAQAFANTAISTANSAQSTANSAQSTASSAASNASTAISRLGSWQASGSSWTFGGTQVLQSDGNLFGSSVFGFLGGSPNLFNALQNLNGRIASDETIKLNVQPMGAGLDVIDALTPVSFQFNQGLAPWAMPGPQIGLIAQEVAALAPAAVTETNGRMGINPLAMVAILVNAVQELKRRIEILEG
nr:tail fiber domain-containing protein [Pannonibacter sp. XCT-34]